MSTATATPGRTGEAGLPRRRLMAWAVLLPALGITSLLLWWQADSARILEDTLQHIGVARNLLRGEGLTTTLLFYDAQYAPQMVPAPQTVWPPGMTLAIAALAWLGLAPETAALLLGWLSFVATACLLLVVLLRVGVAPGIAAAAASLWTLSAANWMSAAIAASELPYAACLLGATAALVAGLAPAPGRLRLIALAGFAAACAIGVRYVGVVFVAAAGCIVLGARQLTWRRRFAAAVAFGALPALAAAALATRNFLATGALSGGQLVVAQGAAPLDAVLRAWWSAVELFALPHAGVAGAVAQWSLLGVLGLAALMAGRLAVARAPHGPDARRTAQRCLLAVALAYCGATVLLHLAWAMTAGEGLLDSRYFEPLLPFAAIVLALAANDARARSRTARRAAVGATAALLLGYALLQWRAWSEAWAGYGSVANERAIERALATPFAGTTVGDWLRSSGTRPILGTLEHALHASLDRAVLGLPDSRYTAKTWDDAAVLDLLRRYDACIVFFVPDRFAPQGRSAANQPFLRSLAAGRPPAWLDTLLFTADVALYRAALDGCADDAAPLTARDR